MQPIRRFIESDATTCAQAAVMTVVALSSGLSSAQAQDHIYTLRGVTNDALGNAVAACGDVNRDGHADIVVAVPGSPQPGSVLVLSGATGLPLFRFRSLTKSDGFGDAVDGAGDVNRDGHPDIIVGATQTAKYGFGTGSAHVFSGKDGKLLYAFHGWNAKQGFGNSVSGAADVNGDGYADVIVGSSYKGAFPLRAGVAVVYSGKDGKALHVIQGKYWGYYGHLVDGAGDVNRDGYDDLIVCDHRVSRQPGSVDLISGKTGKLIRRFQGTTSDWIGSVAANAGDVNRDGYPDQLVYQGWSDKTLGIEIVLVFSGKDGRLLHRFKGRYPKDYFGRSLASAGDVDRDGYSDILISSAGGPPNNSKGYVDLYSGKTGALIRTFWAKGAQDVFGYSVDGAGDVNADGRLDIVIGAPGVGRPVSWNGECHVLSTYPLPLSTDNHLISLAKGGSQSFRIGAGGRHASKFFVLLGSATSTKPGIRVGSVVLPLNPDPYMNWLLLNPNALTVPSYGFLKANGSASSTLRVPGGLDPRLRGLLLHHAYIVFNPSSLSADYASLPVPLTILP